MTLSAYYLDVTETTVSQYKACVDAGICYAPSSVQPVPDATYPGLADHPVNYVSWSQARQYCQWRGEGFDLPTEAQWEMAARGSCEMNGSSASNPNCATSMRTYPWGNLAPTCSVAVFNDSNNGTNPGCGSKALWAVGTKPLGDSPYGVHDMAGNVREWSRETLAQYTATAQTNPWYSDEVGNHIFRGGCYADELNEIRASVREQGYMAGDSGELYDGLRCEKSYP